MKDVSGARILTVEDDEFVRDIIVAYLEDCGFEVLQAENGRIGLDIFRSAKPDLILLDLRMPEMDGLEVLSVITKEAPNTPAIVVSGMGTIGDAIKALKFGAWDYIAKPIHDMAVLEHAVNKALERAELLRQNKRYHEHLEEEVKKRTSELEKAYHNLKKEVDIRRQAEETVCKINLELTMLSDSIHAVVRATSELDLIREICRTIVDVGGYRMTWVGFAENDPEKTVRPIAQAGYEDGYLEAIKITWADTENGRGPTGMAIRTGEPVINSNTLQNPDFILWRDESIKRGYGSSISLPLKSEGVTLGSLSVYAEEPDAFDQNEVQRLMGLADDLTYGVIALRTREERNIANRELENNVAKLRKALEGTVQVVASTVEVRDPYTAGHQRRVAILAKAIAEDLGLSPHQIDGVFMAGVVHDLGKIYVPAEILSKPSRLNDIELSLIRTHPQIGYDLLKPIDFSWPIAQIVYQHHEKMDGSGYPAGLAGQEILLEARIITVADVVEAMASHRPYRPSRGIDKALEQITENRGTLYDSRVVDICLRLFNQSNFKFD